MHDRLIVSSSYRYLDFSWWCSNDIRELNVIWVPAIVVRASGDFAPWLPTLEPNGGPHIPNATAIALFSPWDLRLLGTLIDLNRCTSFFPYRWAMYYLAQNILQTSLAYVTKFCLTLLDICSYQGCQKEAASVLWRLLGFCVMAARREWRPQYMLRHTEGYSIWDLEGGREENFAHLSPHIFVPCLNKVEERGVFKYVQCPSSCSLCENNHYTIKAGEIRATRTLVIFAPPPPPHMRISNWIALDLNCTFVGIIWHVQWAQQVFCVFLDSLQ